MNYDETFAKLQRDFPYKHALTPDDVVRVLKGEDKLTRGRIDTVRKKLGAGGYPGARKSPEGRWELPIDAMAKILTSGETVAPSSEPVASNPAKKPSKRRHAIGHLCTYLRTGPFFVGVFNALGFPDEARELQNDLERARHDAQHAYATAKGLRQKAALQAVLTGIGDDRPSTRKNRPM